MPGAYSSRPHAQVSGAPARPGPALAEEEEEEVKEEEEVGGRAAAQGEAAQARGRHLRARPPPRPPARPPRLRWSPLSRRACARSGGSSPAARRNGLLSPQRPPRARRGTPRYEDAAPARQRRARSDGHASRQAARHRKYSPARARGRPASAPLRPCPRTPPVQPAELPPPPPPLHTRWAPGARGCPPVPARRAEELRPVAASGRAAPGAASALPGSMLSLGPRRARRRCACHLGSSVLCSAPVPPGQAQGLALGKGRSTDGGRRWPGFQPPEAAVALG